MSTNERMPGAAEAMNDVRDGDARPNASERTRDAWVAIKRTELLAPADDIVACSESLLEGARERGESDFVRDMEQMRTSAQRLLTMVHDLLDSCVEERDLARRIRHDLRNPLAHIMGLSEIWLEDAAERLLEGFVNDLRAIHKLCELLLENIDVLLGFSKVASDPAINLEDGEVKLFEDVFKSLPGLVAKQVETRGRLLLVDDHAVSRESLLRRLQRVHDVVQADNGQQALQILRSKPFDLVLLDVFMPEMSGIQVLEQMKADEALRHLPVIMISGYSEMESVARCISKGADDYLTKPCNSVLLKARINACLDRKRLMEQIKNEQARADDLLEVILPRPIAKELKDTNKVLPRRYDQVALLFCDVVGFSPYCDSSNPLEAIRHLRELVETWEEIAADRRHGIEKIKTIGDAFMAAAGLLQTTADEPVVHCVKCGLEMIGVCRLLRPKWNLRIGIHVGPVVAGIIGKRQYLFDLWGDTVKTAQRVENHGVPGKVVLSAPAWKRIAHRARGQSLGYIPVMGDGKLKGKDTIKGLEMYQFEEFI